MNRYAQDMLSRRDGRNPYGSRGGYVTSSRGRGRDRAERGRGMNDMARRGGSRGRDRGYDMNYDMRGYDMRSNMGNTRDRNDYAEYNSQSDYRDYADYDYEQDYRDYEQYGQSDRDYEDMGHESYRPVEAMGYFNGYVGDGYGRRDGNAKLSTKELKKWEKELENADGSKGKKWEVDQIRQVAQQMNIHFDEYRPETLTAVANMLYSDYCKVLGADLMMYVKLAKAFLEDDDFEGDPEEKVMLYYKCIVSKDD